MLDDIAEILHNLAYHDKPLRWNIPHNEGGMSETAKDGWRQQVYKLQTLLESKGYTITKLGE